VQQKININIDQASKPIPCRSMKVFTVVTIKFSDQSIVPRMEILIESQTWPGFKCGILLVKSSSNFIGFTWKG